MKSKVVELDLELTPKPRLLSLRSLEKDNYISYLKGLLNLCYFLLLSPYKYSVDPTTGKCFIESSKWRKVKAFCANKCFRIIKYIHMYIFMYEYTFFVYSQFCSFLQYPYILTYLRDELLRLTSSSRGVKEDGMELYFDGAVVICGCIFVASFSLVISTRQKYFLDLISLLASHPVFSVTPKTSFWKRVRAERKSSLYEGYSSILSRI